MEKRPLIILTGPTAVGKTAASIGLAKAVGGEIISADSMQVYRHMNIGSAKITEEEIRLTYFKEPCAISRVTGKAKNLKTGEEIEDFRNLMILYHLFYYFLFVLCLSQ